MTMTEPMFPVQITRGMPLNRLIPVYTSLDQACAHPPGAGS